MDLPKNIHQILPNFSYGDAIGDDVLRLKSMLNALGCRSEIFAGIIHPKLLDSAHHYKKYKEYSSPDNLLIYHFSVGSEISEFLMEIPDRVLIIFHNITPYEWFVGINRELWELAVEGEQELKSLAERADAGWGDSEYNRRILEKMGFGRTETFPILVHFDHLDAPPNKLVSRIIKQPDLTTFLFVGRITPNKKHEDIIRVFAAYQKLIDIRSRLFFVGEYLCCQKYYHALEDLIRRMRVSNVCFTGLVDQDELIAYYREADLFLCMSEHEGFCVPLLEAMHFDIPVAAYNAAAVPETLDGAGVLLNTKQPVETAFLCHELLTDEKLRHRLIEGQRKRLKHYKNMDYLTMLRDTLDRSLV